MGTGIFLVVEAGIESWGPRPKAEVKKWGPSSYRHYGWWQENFETQGSKMYVLKQNVGVSCLIFYLKNAIFHSAFDQKKNPETIILLLQQRYLTIKLRRMKGA